MSAELTTTTPSETGLVPVPYSSPAHNPALVYLASLSEGSRRTMRQALDVIAGVLTIGTAAAETCPWAYVRAQEATAVRTYLAEHYAPATANKMLTALRGVLSAAQRLVRQAARASMDPSAEWQARAVQDELADALDALKAVKGGRAADDLRGRALEVGEVRALFRACVADSSPAGLRDAALLALGLGAGLRRAELVGLDLAHFTRTGEGGATLTVWGKGNKRRLLPLSNGALDALEDWLSARGEDPGPLFVAVNRGGRLALGARLSEQTVWNMIEKRALEAGVAKFTPHDMRRTFVSGLLDAGADIATVQKLAGHANVTTTARYDRRGERAKRQAVGLVHLPYQRRRLG